VSAFRDFKKRGIDLRQYPALWHAVAVGHPEVLAALHAYTLKHGESIVRTRIVRQELLHLLFHQRQAK
jgi:hypothetical protein